MSIPSRPPTAVPAPLAASPTLPSPVPHSPAVAVGVSGGVDSAVALLRLRDAGQPVRAVFMKNWDEDDADGICPAARDLADARAVCARLGVPLATVNFSYEYWERVFETYLEEHRRGRTPNPDVLCNQEVKFRAFLEHARDLGAQRLATGHYARVARRGGRHVLLRARDEDKDQTYFLHGLDQAQLAAAEFPLGELEKSRVRRIAREAGLAVHDKKDSTGICFIGERDHARFLARFLAPSPGPMEDPGGRRVGEHRGLHFYTIGQRQGLGLGGRRGGSGAPWYVSDKDVARNVLRVVQGRDHPRLWSPALVTGAPHWIAGAAPALPLACEARIRHRQAPQRCRVTGRAGGGLEVRFARAQWAVTPGQCLVLYHGEECLGGAVIEAPWR